jgi:hypothetical protein
VEVRKTRALEKAVSVVVVVGVVVQLRVREKDELRRKNT